MTDLKPIKLVLTAAVLATATLALGTGSAVAPAPVRAAVADRPHLLPLTANIADSVTASSSVGLFEPVTHFKDRITKKTFGMYITPATSPVEHDKFSGFHTGVDAEFTDTTGAVPVVAVADGVVVFSRWATGYGGVIVVKNARDDIPRYALYGHLNAATLLPVGTHVTAGQRLGLLGDDHSEQTDGVRKHLHFSLYTGDVLDIRGYVPTKEDLANWADPLAFF